MDKEQLDKLTAFIQENKGQRKFTQSVELAVNFSGIDFTKQDNRLNLQVALPNGKGKVSSVIIFADDLNIKSKAEAAGAKVIDGKSLPSIATDKAQMNELLENELIAQASLMPQIAKSLGQFLGPRNKMPKPLVGGDVQSVINSISKSTSIRSKGKYLPTVHCVVGNEKMDAQQLAANIDEVIGAIAKKLGRHTIKSAYVKLTMSAPVRLI
ncbi:MAG: hypothetical protein KGH98_01835 [Candidatus Micrarchaeota archaeon]|nr:hypothetical protein [Candidatus Micrarchaeota archaeon]